MTQARTIVVISGKIPVFYVILDSILDYQTLIGVSEFFREVLISLRLRKSYLEFQTYL